MWYKFELFALAALLFWLLSMVFSFIRMKNESIRYEGIFSIGGTIILSVFICILWINLSRPPLRTIGETRLWYSFFISLIGYLIYIRWNYKWILFYCLLLASVFLLVNYLKPDAHSKTLMPALQSIWFIPHVIVYMLAYAFLAVSSIIGFKGLFESRKNPINVNIVSLADNIVYAGFGFLTLGIVFGALWAKEAWGQYWTWDPKETWALITWLIYLIYMHFRHNKPTVYKLHLFILALAFIILLLCWLGLKYLPSALGSVHVYGQ